jgi:hypothetical protein
MPIDDWKYDKIKGFEIIVFQDLSFLLDRTLLVIPLALKLRGFDLVINLLPIYHPVLKSDSMG